MKILALESSAVAASVALTDGDTLIAQHFMNTSLTHSRTLMPMAEGLLALCGIAIHDVDVVAVAAGPGSFTGIRIGLSAAKGLAWAADKPCAGVSTLEAMAWQAAHMGGNLCAVMDARRGEFYNALFAGEGGAPRRLTPDRAIPGAGLLDELARCNGPIILVGDGAALCLAACAERGVPAALAPPHLRFQSAWGVAQAALKQAAQGGLTDAAGLEAHYHRLSQAEREYEEKRNESEREKNHGTTAHLNPPTAPA